MATRELETLLTTKCFDYDDSHKVSSIERGTSSQQANTSAG